MRRGSSTGQPKAGRRFAAGMALVAPMLMGVSAQVSTFEERLLAAQNRERSALGIEPMQWNADLASDAQVWADYLAKSGQFEHAPRYMRAGAGENLWAGTRNAYSAEQMVDGWAREKKQFTPGPFPADIATIRAVGHYTQIVWRDSRRVGCAVARGREMDYLVCRYGEAGNIIGRMPY